MQFLKNLIFPGGFMPHGYCYLWSPGLIGLHVVSDALIALSYLSIPVTLVHFTRKRQDVPFSWVFLCFGAFIVACGGTHLMEIWTVWFPSYWLAGGLKAATACISVATAILLIHVVPEALALPGTQRLLEANRKLSGEVESHEQAESTLRHMSEMLEERVAERTAALLATNQSLRESEERYRTLVENAPEAIVVVDPEVGRFVDLNEKAEHLFGMNRDELLKVGLAEVSPKFQPDGRPSTEAAAEEMNRAMRLETPCFEWIIAMLRARKFPAKFRWSDCLPRAAI
jgi:PAS domain-containing protein